MRTVQDHQFIVAIVETYLQEDVDQHMAILPEVETPTEEIKIDDILCLGLVGFS